MPIPTPFFPRMSASCRSLRWKNWAGYHAVCSYDAYHEREYYALRHAAGLIDVTPLHKYDLHGPAAAAFLSYLTVRNVAKLKAGRVTYGCWCDDHGKLIDDGTIWRLDESHYRLTSTEPAWGWLQRHARGFDVTIEDRSQSVAVLSLQGPNAREVLVDAAGSELAALRWFGTAPARIDGFDARVTRTGYTGDLGYEVWVDNDDALRLWDVLAEAGKPYGLLPAGLDAMDMTRVEAGFILNGVDYFAAQQCAIESRKSSPYEMGLGWTVSLDREPFIGQAALRAECRRGGEWAFAGLEYDWDEYEALFAAHGLPADVCASAWRSPLPVYDATTGKQVGYATSGTWSPLLKKHLAQAHVHAHHSGVGTRLKIEVTVEFERKRVTATVVNKPFFDPQRKRG